MDPQSVIDTALAAGATTLGSAAAAEIFREAYKSTPKVTVNLTPGQRQLIQKNLNFPVTFTGGKNVTNDHPVLVAFRDLARTTFQSEHKIAQCKERALVIGASMREIKTYFSNPHIHYYVYGKENKDYDRIVRPALNEISDNLRKKASKKNNKIFVVPGTDQPRERPCVKRYTEMRQILSDYMLLNKMPHNIHTQLVEAETLVFEDSHYNFSAEDWINVFDATGAQAAYGYGLLPMELLYQDMPANPLYRIVIDKCKGTTTLVFNNSYCNGYVHNTKAWSTLMTSPVIAVPGKKTVLAVEITSKIGPAAVFKVYRCKHPERIARSMDLSPRDSYVKVLDICQAVNRQTGKVKYPLKYISMREDEYLDVFNYALSLDEKSLTFPNIMSYMRRRMGGLSLITKELVEPWYLPKKDVQIVAITVLIDVRVHHTERKLIEENINVGSVLEKFAVLFKKCARVIFYPIALLIDFILSGHLTDKLVLYQDGTCYQSATVRPNGNVSIDSGLYADHPYEGEIPACPICFECMGKLGDQELECKTKESTHEFQISSDAIKNLHTKLIDNDEDAPGLKAVKERAAKNLPTTGFTHTVTLRVLEAGPGCGKSYMIRQLATEHDLVLAPFTKLRADYTGLQALDGSLYDLNFKTVHRAMEARGCRRIFVDEYTAFPYEFLACVAFLNASTEVILVGDRKQTGIQEPAEGMNMLNHISIDDMCTHTLRKNFRNPADTVAMLNRIFDYKMEPVKKYSEPSVTFVTIDQLPRMPKSTSFAFTKASAKAQTESEANTVRSFQGSTCEKSILFCTSLDGSLPSVEQLQIVALSRHTDHLYIVHDNCKQAQQLMEKLRMDADFYSHMETWITFPREDTRRVTQEDKDVPVICRPQQPAKDAYLLLDTFVPSAATDPDCTSLNIVGSNLVGEHFASGKTVPEFLIMPKNKRNHTAPLQETYYSVGSGIGNHFSSKQPLQTLQVLQARYLNKQPFFPFTGH